MWTPDAYEGAPTPATTFMAVVREDRGVRRAAARAARRLRRRALGRARARGWPPRRWPALAVADDGLRQRRRRVRRRASSACWRTRRSRTPATSWSASSPTFAEPRARRRPRRVLFYLLAYTVSNVRAFGSLIALRLARQGGRQLRGPRRRRPPPSAARAAVLALPAVADGLSADRGLLRQVVRVQRGASQAGDGMLWLGRARRAEQRDRRVLLPARDGVSVHERARAGRADRRADALGLRRGRAAGLGLPGAGDGHRACAATSRSRWPRPRVWSDAAAAAARAAALASRCGAAAASGEAPSPERPASATAACGAAAGSRRRPACSRASCGSRAATSCRRTATSRWSARCSTHAERRAAAGARARRRARPIASRCRLSRERRAVRRVLAASEFSQRSSARPPGARGHDRGLPPDAALVVAMKGDMLRVRNAMKYPFMPTYARDRHGAHAAARPDLRRHARQAGRAAAAVRLHRAVRPHRRRRAAASRVRGDRSRGQVPLRRLSRGREHGARARGIRCSRRPSCRCASSAASTRASSSC